MPMMAAATGATVAVPSEVWKLIALVFVGGIGWGLWKRFQDERGRSSGSGGSASANRLASRRQLRPLLLKRPEAGRMAFAVFGEGRRRRFLATERQASAVVVAPPRQGKTRHVVGPIVAEWRGPAVVVSLRSDLLVAAAPNPGNVLAFYPSELAKQGVTEFAGVPLVGWSPLDGISEALALRGLDWAYDESLAMGESQVPLSPHQDPIWAQGARRVAAAMLLAAVVDHRPLSDYLTWGKGSDLVSPFYALTEPDETGASDASFADSVDNPFAGRIPRPGVPEAAVQTLSGMAFEEEKIRSGYMTTLKTALSVYDWPSVRKAAEMPYAERFRPSWLLDPEGVRRTLYLVGTLDDQSKFAPVLLGIVSEIRRTREREANEREASKGNKRYAFAASEDLLLVFDEAANLVPIPDLGSMITTAGGSGMTVLLVYHDLSQLRERLGEHGAASVFSACQARVILGGVGDPGTLMEFSRLSGQQQVTRRSSSQGGGQTSTSQSTESVPLLDEAALRLIQKGQMVVIYGNTPVARARLRDAVEPKAASRAVRAAGDDDGGTSALSGLWRAR